jgi:integrase
VYKKGGTLMSRGRKARITRVTYLKHVRKTRSTNDETIADSMGLNRSSVYRFRISNPMVFEEAKQIIAKLETVRFDPENITLEMFEQIPTIVKWVSMQDTNEVGKQTMETRTATLFKVCNHLGVHPDQLTLDACSSLVVEARKAKDSKIKFHHGLAYHSIRKPIRSFFQLIRGISGELLTARGIDAGRSSGTGSHSKQRVTKEQRARFMESLPIATKQILSLKKYQSHLHLIDKIILEMKGITYFMYYTGTRIGATNPKKQGSLSVKLNNDKHQYNSTEWSLNLIDKGKKGGIEWDKLLMDDGIVKMREYLIDRFNLNPDTLEIDILTIDSYMFPFLNDNYDIERQIMKLALSMAGCITNIPNHIWRHTFAQDFLHATSWNYELCGAIGGWKDTGTLKLSYGKMSDDAKRRGLRVAMKLEIADEHYELRY